jgi:hypothetical protein
MLTPLIREAGRPIHVNVLARAAVRARLINLVVYRSYGSTDEELAVVEGRS